MNPQTKRFVKKVPASGVAPTYKLSLPHQEVHECLQHLLAPNDFELATSTTSEKSWQASIVPRRNKDRAEYLLKGWKLFAEAHNVKLGDQYSFELVSPRRLVVRLLTRGNEDSDTHMLAQSADSSPRTMQYALQSAGDLPDQGGGARSGGLGRPQAQMEQSTEELTHPPAHSLHSDVQESPATSLVLGRSSRGSTPIPDWPEAPAIAGTLASADEHVGSPHKVDLERQPEALSELPEAFMPPPSTAWPQTALVATGLPPLTVGMQWTGQPAAEGALGQAFRDSSSSSSRLSQKDPEVPYISAGASTIPQAAHSSAGVMGYEMMNPVPPAVQPVSSSILPLSSSPAGPQIIPPPRPAAAALQSSHGAEGVTPRHLEQYLQHLTTTIEGLQTDVNIFESRAARAEHEEAMMREFVNLTRCEWQRGLQTLATLERLTNRLVDKGCSCMGGIMQAPSNTLHSTKAEMTVCMDAIRNSIWKFLSTDV